MKKWSCPHPLFFINRCTGTLVHICTQIKKHGVDTTPFFVFRVLAMERDFEYHVKLDRRIKCEDSDTIALRHNGTKHTMHSMTILMVVLRSPFAVQTLDLSEYYTKLHGPQRRKLTNQVCKRTDIQKMYVHNREYVMVAAILRRSKSLTTMNLSGNGQSPRVDGLRTIAEVAKDAVCLEQLSIDHSCITDDELHVVLSNLIENKRITFVSFIRNAITDASVDTISAYLTACPTIAHFWLDDNKRMSDEAMATLEGAHSGVRFKCHRPYNTDIK